MKLNHAALRVSSVENADRFFRDLLGLERLGPKTISADLSLKVFDIEAEIQAVDYALGDQKFEVFIDPEGFDRPAAIAHMGLDAPDKNDLRMRAEEMGLEVRLVPKGERMLLFIKDFDGNLFEIK